MKVHELKSFISSASDVIDRNFTLVCEFTNMNAKSCARQAYTDLWAVLSAFLSLHIISEKQCCDISEAAHAVYKIIE